MLPEARNVPKGANGSLEDGDALRWPDHPDAAIGDRCNACTVKSYPSERLRRGNYHSWKKNQRFLGKNAKGRLFGHKRLS
jgi:hypothetical protein